MKCIKKIFITVITLFSLIAIYLPQSAEAIPAFARKYAVKCTQCHVQFPKLNEFGVAFKNRGYRMMEEKGDYIWNSKVFPIAAIGRFGYVYEDKEEGGASTTKGEIEFDGLEIFSAGVLAPNISFFIDALTEDNLPLVQFDDILSNSRLNLKAGVFNVDNYYLSHPRRLTQTSYLAQTTSDREDNVTFGNEGIELNGQFYDSGFRYILGVGDGSVEGHDHAFGQLFYGFINKAFGDHTLTLMFRRDNAGTSDDNTAGPDTSDDTFTFGGGMDFVVGGLVLDVAGYYFDGGDSLDFTENGNNVDYEAFSGTVEGVYSFSDKWLGLVRYDWHDTLDSAASEDQYVLSLQYFFQPNIKLNLEYINKDIEVGGNTNRTAEEEEQLKLWIRFGF